MFPDRVHRQVAVGRCEGAGVRSSRHPGRSAPPTRSDNTSWSGRRGRVARPRRTSAADSRPSPAAASFLLARRDEVTDPTSAQLFRYGFAESRARGARDCRSRRVGYAPATFSSTRRAVYRPPRRRPPVDRVGVAPTRRRCGSAIPGEVPMGCLLEMPELTRLGSARASGRRHRPRRRRSRAGRQPEPSAHWITFAPAPIARNTSLPRLAASRSVIAPNSPRVFRARLAWPPPPSGAAVSLRTRHVVVDLVGIRTTRPTSDRRSPLGVGIFGGVLHPEHRLGWRVVPCDSAAPRGIRTGKVQQHRREFSVGMRNRAQLMA